MHGMVLREGSIIDASFVDVPRQRNSKKDNADIKKGVMPLEFVKSKSNVKVRKNSSKYIKFTQLFRDRSGIIF
jgi:hypothetical protein